MRFGAEGELEALVAVVPCDASLVEPLLPAGVERVDVGRSHPVAVFFSDNRRCGATVGGVRPILFDYREVFVGIPALRLRSAPDREVVLLQDIRVNNALGAAAAHIYHFPYRKQPIEFRDEPTRGEAATEAFRGAFEHTDRALAPIAQSPAIARCWQSFETDWLSFKAGRGWAVAFEWGQSSARATPSAAKVAFELGGRPISQSVPPLGDGRFGAFRVAARWFAGWPRRLA
jgi:hypothetical protein